MVSENKKRISNRQIKEGLDIGIINICNEGDGVRAEIGKNYFYIDIEKEQIKNRNKLIKSIKKELDRYYEDE